ncbi:MAG: chemotaxis protein CheW [Ignavibacteriaceae bacterium]
MSINKEQRIETAELLQLVTFNIGKEEFGVDILNVQEINRMTHITKVPNAPHFVEGVINLRGRVIPVIDLRLKLKIEKKEYDKNTRIIVVEVENKTIGFIVDSVNEVLRIPANLTEAPPDMVAGIESEYIKSVGKLEDRLLILIDIQKIIQINEMKKLEIMETVGV